MKTGKALPLYDAPLSDRILAPPQLTDVQIRYVLNVLRVVDGLLTGPKATRRVLCGKLCRYVSVPHT